MHRQAIRSQRLTAALYTQVVPTTVSFAGAGASLTDRVLLREWDDRSAQGLFRYDVSHCETKVTPGVYAFVLQLNEGRANKKRATEFSVDQVVQPYAHNKFNFTKAAMKEVRCASPGSCMHCGKCMIQSKSCLMQAQIECDVNPTYCIHVEAYVQQRAPLFVEGLVTCTCLVWWFCITCGILAALAVYLTTCVQLTVQAGTCMCS